VHAAFVAFASQANSQHNIAVGRYVIMPDHVHLFVRGPTIFNSAMVGMLKQALAKAYRRYRDSRRSGSAAFLITFCAVMKATATNGITFERIPFVLGW
jgi:REP element-mobilizing transposase RayT